MDLITSRRQLEEVTIIGPSARRDEVFRWLIDGDWNPIYSGPKPIGGLRFDPDKFKIVAQREIEK